MFPEPVLRMAAEVVDSARSAGLKLATAESCTGGLIGAAITAIPGSSDVFERGAIAYAYEAKTQMLGVPAELLARVGAVSPEVAQSMAQGALAHSAADISVSCTGIAGPGGGTAAKPVGLVYLATARKQKTRVLECQFGDVGRDEVRMRTV